MPVELALTLDAASLRNMLGGTDEFLDAPRFFEGLSAEQACTSIEGFPHSIAGLLAHMLFWQERRIAWAKQLDPPEWTEAENFPQVKPEDWPGLLERFLAGFDLLCSFATPEHCGRELYRGRSVGFMLASHCCHNAYHLGQIALMRQLLGCWPGQPKAG